MAIHSIRNSVTGQVTQITDAELPLYLSANSQALTGAPGTWSEVGSAPFQAGFKQQLPADNPGTTPTSLTRALTDTQSGSNIPRLVYVDPQTGRVDTGLADGTDPKQFGSMAEFQSFQQSSGETQSVPITDPTQAFQIVRDFTGNPNYNGYYAGYQPPAASGSSPMGRGVPFSEWYNGYPGNPNRDPNATPSTGSGTLPGGGTATGGAPGAPGTPPAPGTPVGTAPTGPQTAAPTGTPGVDAGNFNGLINQLINEARGQSAAGQADISGVMGQLSGLLGISQDALTNALTQTNNVAGAGGLLNQQAQFNSAAEQQTYGQRNDLVSQMLGMTTPAITSAISNQNQGLDPAVEAAMRTNAMDTTSRSYNDASSALASQLMRSGSMGAQDGSGGVGQLVAGYGGLESARIGNQSALLGQIPLANQQAMQQNRSNALQAAGLGSSLTSALGSIYNPAPLGDLAQQNISSMGTLENPSTFANSSNNALQTLLSGANSSGQLGISGINASAPLVGSLADTTPGSFRNTLIASLLSSFRPSVTTGTGGTSVNVGFGTTPTPQPIQN